MTTTFRTAEGLSPDLVTYFERVRGFLENHALLVVTIAADRGDYQVVTVDMVTAPTPEDIIHHELGFMMTHAQALPGTTGHGQSGIIAPGRMPYEAARAVIDKVAAWFDLPVDALSTQITNRSY